MFGRCQAHPVPSSHLLLPVGCRNSEQAQLAVPGTRPSAATGIISRGGSCELPRLVKCLDERAGAAVARWLREQQHEVFSAYAEDQGMDDEDMIRRAFSACLSSRLYVFGLIVCYRRRAAESERWTRKHAAEAAST
jgi:hypothetical protein